MQQRVTAHAHQFSSVPRQECSGKWAHARRMVNAPQADRAALPLIAKRPLHSEQTDEKCRYCLHIQSLACIEPLESKGEIERCKIGNHQYHCNLGAEKA